MFVVDYATWRFDLTYKELKPIKADKVLVSFEKSFDLTYKGIETYALLKAPFTAF